MRYILTKQTRLIILPISLNQPMNTKHTPEIQLDELKSKWLELSDTEKIIMGRPNFVCAKIAHRMRAMGFEVAGKAEKEQALVIWAMLEFYKVFGPEWAVKMNEFLKNENTP